MKKRRRAGKPWPGDCVDRRVYPAPGGRRRRRSRQRRTGIADKPASRWRRSSGATTPGVRREALDACGWRWADAWPTDCLRRHRAAGRHARELAPTSTARFEPGTVQGRPGRGCGSGANLSRRRRQRRAAVHQLFGAARHSAAIVMKGNRSVFQARFPCAQWRGSRNGGAPAVWHQAQDRATAALAS